MRLNRKNLIFLFGFLGLFSIFALLFYISNKIENIKEPLITFLKSQIAGNLVIQEAKVSFFPPGIDLQNISVFAPGEEKPSVTAQSGKLRFHYIPWLQDKIQITLYINKPEVIFYKQANGQSNMEQIFAPLLKGAGQSSSFFSKFWRGKLEVDGIRIKQGKFLIESQGEETEIKNIQLKADQIQFEKNKPAQIQAQFLVPRWGSKDLSLEFPLLLEKEKTLKVAAGNIRWDELKAEFQGQIGLPDSDQKDPSLNIELKSSPDFKTLASLAGLPPGEGNLNLSVHLKGSVFAPVISFEVDSPQLKIKEKKLTNIKLMAQKKEEPFEIEKASFHILGGDIQSSGTVLLKAPSAQLKVQANNLSLAEISGDKTQRARLSANLNLENKNLKNESGWTGAGAVNLGPFPIPATDLSQKVRVAEILAMATSLDQKINIGMLKSSSNVVGTQIDQIRANINFAGDTVNITSFNLGNSHFTASGSGTLVQQKRINASGVAVLSSAVTAELFPDAPFRNALTEGKGSFSVPFRVTGNLPDPEVLVDQEALKQIIHRATLLTVKDVLLGGVRPQKLIDSAIQNSPLGKIFKKQDPNAPPPPPAQNPPPQRNPIQELLFGR